MTATMVTLVDGRLALSDAEDFRHECECREILRMPLDKRRAWLADLEQKRGPEAVERIKATLTALHEARAA